MSKNQSVYSFIIYLFLGVLFSYSLSAEILSCTLVSAGTGTVIVCCVVCLVILYLIFYNKYTMISVLVFLAVAVLIILFDFLSGRGDDSYVKLLYDFFYRQSMFIRGFLPYEREFMLPVTAVICLCFSGLFVLLYGLFNSFMSLLLTGIAVFATNIIFRYHNNDVFILTFLLFSIIMLFQRLNGRREMGSDSSARGNAAFTLSIVPICILAVIIANNIPSPGNIGRNLFRGTLNGTLSAVEDFLYVAFNPKYYSFQTSGFSSGNSRLGGNITLDNSNVLKVKTDRQLYLAGEIKSEYTGSAWKAIDDVSERYYGYTTNGFTGGINNYLKALGVTGNVKVMPNLDAFELYVNLGVDTMRVLPDDEDMSSYINAGVSLPEMFSADIKAGKVTVTPIKRFGSLFFPTSFVYLEFNAPDIDYNGFTLRSPSLLPKDVSYTYYYIPIDINDKDFIDYLRTLDRGYYDDLGARVEQISTVITEAVGTDVGLYFQFADDTELMAVTDTLEFLSLRSEGIFERYTALPDELPERVRELAVEITSRYENDYDKAKAVERYLSAFTYTLTPGDTPENRDFVDYFIFEQREGYCTHFATAFSVLCRAAGVPVRYVEGFTLPQRTHPSGEYIITNAQAHAWPEVYFEGAGWVRFEPTVQYSDTSGTQLERDNIGATDAPAEPYEEIPQSSLRDNKTDRSSANRESRLMGNAVVTPEKTERSLRGLVLGTIALGILAIAAYLGSIYAKVALRLKQLDRKDKKLAICDYFNRIMVIIGKINRAKYDGETVLTYSGNYSDWAKKFSCSSGFKEAAAIYSRVAYSQSPPSDIEYERMKNLFISYDMRLKVIYRELGYLGLILFDKDFTVFRD